MNSTAAPSPRVSAAAAQPAPAPDSTPAVDPAAVRVVKIGGAAIDAGDAAAPLWSALARWHRSLTARGGGLVIVHGGGAAVDRHLARLGIEPRRIDGLRVTSEPEADEVVAVIAGLVAGRLAGRLAAAGATPVSLELSSGGTLALDCPDPDRLGRVGRPVGGDPALLRTLLGGGWLPCLACVGRDAGGFLNVNADEAAAAVAGVLAAGEFVLLTDVAGVRDGVGGTGEVIAELDRDAIVGLEAAGVIAGGMIPKVRAALAAAESSGRPVRIASWTDPASIDGGGTLVRPTAGGGPDFTSGAAG
ncbi:MAG: acetylglutamate kinase [Planctomycetota bacterium]|jgi:acetylglutamate kinase